MAKAQDIRAGKAFVELSLKDELVKGLTNARRQLQNFSRDVQLVGASLLKMGAAITAPLLGATFAFAKAGDEIDKLSARTGVGAETLSELAFAAEQSGASLEVVAKAMHNMQKKGLDPKLFEEYAAEIAAIEDPLKRAEAAMQVFGPNAGQQLLPMLGNIKELREEAQALGKTMSQEDAAAAADLADAWNRLTTAAKAVTMQVGAALAPAIADLSEWLTAIVVPTREWVKENRDTLVTLLKIGGVLIGTGAGILALAKTIGIAASALGVFTAAVKVAAAATAFLYANPVILGLALVAAAVAGITYALGASERQANQTAKSLAAVTAEARKTHEQNMAMRGEDVAKMRRLEELNRLQELHGSLTKEQTEEAAKLIALLTGRYGDLGITLDETTGKLSGVSGAMQGLVNVMREMAAMELEQQFRAIREEIAGIEKQTAKANIRSSTRIELLRRRNALDVEGSNLLRNIRRLRGGEGEGFAAGSAAAGGAMPVDEAAREALEKRIRDRIFQMNIAAIEDQKEQELAIIRDRYNQEMEEAQGHEELLRNLKETTQREIAAVEEKYRAQRQAADERAAEEAADRERRERERAASDITAMQKDIERARIEAFGGDELEKRRQLLELEHRWELAAIAARKDLSDEERRQLEEMATRLHGLKLGALDKGDMPEAARESVAASFSAAALSMLSGGGVQDRILRVNEDQKKVAERQLEEERRIQQAIDNLGNAMQVV